MIVEVCANGFESAFVAQRAGAHRIELCSQLSVGGITPSRQEIKKVLSSIDLPVHVLIRPRAGNFCYTEKETHHLLEEIQFCKELGVSGIVSGALTSEKEVDIPVTKQLLLAAEGMNFTFHRAFDEVPFPKQAMETLVQLGVDRILTSGQQNTAVKGLALLKELAKVAANRIEIMPGAGIGSQNVSVFKTAGFPSIHFSATMGKPDAVSDEDEIRKVVQLIQS